MSELHPRPTAIFTSPIGQIAIVDDTQHITHIRFVSDKTSNLAPTTALAEKTLIQLENYFKDPEYTFSLPIKLKGTDFQVKVWQALQTIPTGKTRTYGELATQVQSHARAIGQGCRTNPLLIVVPCHRVVAKVGLGGFMGTQQDGLQLDTKKWLLAHENS